MAITKVESFGFAVSGIAYPDSVTGCAASGSAARRLSSSENNEKEIYSDVPDHTDIDSNRP